MPHQAKSWHSCQLQLTYCSFALAIVALLTACVGERNEFTVPASAGGVAPVAQPQGGATQVVKPQQPLAPPIHPMLQDPEAQQPAEYDEPILAASKEEAERICRDKAKRDGVEVVRVQEPSKIRKGKNQQYRCWFKYQG